MRHDLEIPERYGLRQSVGDTVGPGGIVRALRNIPVLVGIARDMEDVCPDAWMLNLTNPMTTLCRAVTRETGIRTIGLCHEITIAQFMLSLCSTSSFLDLQLTVAGVNHLPFITESTQPAKRRLRPASATCSTTPTSAPTNRSPWPSPTDLGPRADAAGAASGPRATSCA